MRASVVTQSYKVTSKYSTVPVAQYQVALEIENFKAQSSQSSFNLPSLHRNSHNSSELARERLKSVACD